ncbi:MAG: hypothetical protein JXN60_00745 [Lentisphaerae bacterium]|nr:hypothetical protein [Lentisphaerota bacterium]
MKGMKEGMRLRFLVGLGLASGLFTAAGCVTNIREAESSPKGPSEPFSNFRTIRLKHVTIGEAYVSKSANRNAAKKIDKVLFKEMKRLFPNKLQDVDTDGAEKKSFTNCITVEPVIEEIKLKNHGLRLILRSFAGYSEVLMKVTFRDEKDFVIAKPEFYRNSSAFEGTYSSIDNAMLTEIARDIAMYIAANQ